MTGLDVPHFGEFVEARRGWASYICIEENLSNRRGMTRECAQHIARTGIPQDDETIELTDSEKFAIGAVGNA